MRESSNKPGPEPSKEQPRTMLRRRTDREQEPKNPDSKPWKDVFEMQTGKFYRQMDEGGKLYERDALGAPKLDAKAFKFFSEFFANKRRWMPIDQILEKVHQFYENDPLNPERPYAKELLNKITELENTDNEKPKTIKFYTTVDIKGIDTGGVDAFFEMENEKGDFVTAPIDITLMDAQTKMEKRIAKEIEADRPSNDNLDVIYIDQVPIKKTDLHYKEAIEYYAKKIHEKLKSKMPK
ncbi:hypothetical protein KKG19_00260 [Patescibacteria group bacterium]|nr:hypothetical protein [Patescibacteria group bacterium]